MDLTVDQEKLIFITATNLVPAGFFFLLTVSFQVFDCRRAVRSWSYSVSGLPDTPRYPPTSCWAGAGARHLLQISLAVTAVLSTVILYLQINALLLVIIYIIFILASILDIIASSPRYLVMPTRSSGLLSGLGFLMFSLFVLNCQVEGPGKHEMLLAVLSTTVSILCFLEVAYSEQYQTCQTITFCLNILTLGVASWLCQGAVLSLLQVCVGSSLLITLFCCHLAVLSMLGIILAVWINKTLLRQFSRQVSRPGSLMGSSILSTSSGAVRRTNKY